jgi:hypothetical protein
MSTKAIFEAGKTPSATPASPASIKTIDKGDASLFKTTNDHELSEPIPTPFKTFHLFPKFPIELCREVFKHVLPARPKDSHSVLLVEAIPYDDIPDTQPFMNFEIMSVLEQGAQCSWA